MKERARRFRSAVRRVNRGGAQRRRFSDDLRREAVVYARDRRAEGASWSAVGEELGLRPPLIQKWSSALGNAFARVEIADGEAMDVKAGRLVVRTVEGHEVAGLSLEQAARLLRLLQ